MLGVISTKLGKDNEALVRYAEALHRFKQEKADRFIAMAYLSIAVSQKKLSNYDDAINNYVSAAKIFKTVNNLSGQASIDLNLGNLFITTGDFSSAESSLKKSLSLNTMLGDSLTIGLVHNALGELYTKEDKQKSAEYNLYTALRIDNSIQNKEGRATVTNNLGLLYLKKKNYALATKFFQQSYTICSELNDNQGMLVCLKNVGDLNIAVKHYDIAQKNLESALLLARQGKYRKETADIYKTLYHLFRQTNKLPEAINYLEKYHSLNDSIFDERKTNLIASIQTKYNVNEIEHENALLSQQSKIQTLTIEKQQQIRNFFIAIASILAIMAGIFIWQFIAKRKANNLLQQTNKLIDAKNTLLEKTKKELQDSLQEKELLIKEIHHRVKNNLQLISSLLSLQKQAAEDERAAKIIMESQSRVKSIALIHEKLYQSERLAEIDLNEYINELVGYLRNSFQQGTQIRFSVQAQHVMTDVDTAVRLGLVINELVCNAIKYAFPDSRSGEITIKLTQDTTNTQLSVADNGIGIGSAGHVTIDAEKNSSLGYKLVKAVVRQLHGTLTVLNQSGTTVEVAFPLSQAATLA